jgi:hypothetical protein
MSPLKRFLHGVDCFDAAVWEESSEGERGQFDFLGDRIDEEDGNRLTLRHGTIPVFVGKPAVREVIQRGCCTSPPRVNQLSYKALLDTSVQTV